MTELERARAHLRECQRILYSQRRAWPHLCQGEMLSRDESNVLAALSWVWDAQERERMAQAIPIEATITINTGAIDAGGIADHIAKHGLEAFTV